MTKTKSSPLIWFVTGMLHFIIAEAALELIPKELHEFPDVIASATASGKSPSQILLDKSYHFNAMNKLKDKERRGRPDIIQLTLLNLLGSPLCLHGQLAVYVHTRDDRIINMDPEVRIPRNYNRFVGLFEQLLEKGRAPESGKPLLWVNSGKIKSLLGTIKPYVTISFGRTGRPSLLEDVFPRDSAKPICVIVGGFPHGSLSKSVISLSKYFFAIDPAPLDTWVVAARIVHECENAIDLARQRLSL